MSHLVVLPIVLPSLVAPFLVLALRHDLPRQRLVSLAATALLVAIAIRLYLLAGEGAPLVYRLGAWPAPYGIVMVLDRLSATMLLLTAVLGLAVALYASTGWDARGRHFHALFQFQLMGINGAFLTGDVFNLFVFFEVMLIASYGLLLHGGGTARLRAGFHYVAINLVGSTLFLFAVGLIYAVTGTLNMADLVGRVAAVAPGDAALLRTGALLLFVVFALKAALVPLHWWLPTAYAAAPGPVAALFMIMTKVGAYAILRVYPLAFGAGAGPLADTAQPWILPAAAASLVLGAVGALASRTFAGLACFSVVWSMGSLLIALAAFDRAGIAAGLYYLVHSTIAGAALFLIADLLLRTGGRRADRIAPPDAAAPSGLAALFFVAAVGMAGMPPLSGFVGKLLILDATRGVPAAAGIWALVLGTSLVVILAYARAGSTLFWKAAPGGRAAGPAVGPALEPSSLGVCAALLTATALLAALAGPISRELAETAAQVLDREGYVRAVLGTAAPDADRGR